MDILNIYIYIILLLIDIIFISKFFYYFIEILFSYINFIINIYF